MIESDHQYQRDNEMIQRQKDLSNPPTKNFIEILSNLFPDLVIRPSVDFDDKTERCPYDVIVSGKNRIRIELECGLKQHYWTGKKVKNVFLDAAAKPRWHCLSVLPRKIGENRWDVFIKFNVDATSFWAIEYGKGEDLGWFTRIEPKSLNSLVTMEGKTQDIAHKIMFLKDGKRELETEPYHMAWAVERGLLIIDDFEALGKTIRRLAGSD